MDRCPNCRARRDDGNICRRCGMDLAALLDVEQAAEALIARAIGQLVQGQSDAALCTLAKAEALRADPLVSHLRACAAAGCCGSTQQS